MKRFGFSLVEVLLVIVLIAGLCGFVQAAETKYASSSSGTSAALTFGPGAGQRVVTAISASCDKSLGALSFYARFGKAFVTNATATATNIVTINNSAGVFSNSDTVVYCQKDGTLITTTISGVSATSVTLGTATSAAATVSDAIYKVTLAGKIIVGANGAGAGTNTFLNLAGKLFATPGDSPLYVTLESTTNTCLQVSVD